MKRIIICAVLVLFSGLNMLAQKDDYSKYPGYVDLKDIASYAKGDKGTEIIVEAGMFKMLAKMAGENDKDLSEQLGNLKLVRLNSFEIDESTVKSIENKMASMDKELTGKNWDRIARMKSEIEYTNIYVKTSATDKFLGIVVTSINSHSQTASFVNVVGEINPEVIGKLAKNLNIPHLGKISKGMKKQ